MKEHTKLPWRSGYIPMMPEDIYLEDTDGNEIGMIETEADAQFIVKACNAFASLVQELNDAIQLLDYLGENTTEFKKALDF